MNLCVKFKNVKTIFLEQGLQTPKIGGLDRSFE